MAEDADLLGSLRELLWQSGILVSSVAEGMAEKGAKFSDYFAFRQPIRRFRRIGRWPCFADVTRTYFF